MYTLCLYIYYICLIKINKMNKEQIKSVILQQVPDIESDSLIIYKTILEEANKLAPISSFHIAIGTQGMHDNHITLETNTTIIFFQHSIGCKLCIKQFLQKVAEFTEEDPGERYGDDFIILNFDF